MTRICFKAAVAAATFVFLFPSFSLAADVTASKSAATAASSPSHALHYTRAQGLRIIAVSWLQSLRQPKGREFNSVSIGRYGYAPMEGKSDASPPGFSTMVDANMQIAGGICVTCRAPVVTPSNNLPAVRNGSRSLDFQAFLADVNVGRVAVATASF